jgi:hypothetical protein
VSPRAAQQLAELEQLAGPAVVAKLATLTPPRRLDELRGLALLGLLEPLRAGSSTKGQR